MTDAVVAASFPNVHVTAQIAGHPKHNNEYCATSFHLGTFEIAERPIWATSRSSESFYQMTAKQLSGVTNGCPVPRARPLSHLSDRLRENQTLA